MYFFFVARHNLHFQAVFLHARKYETFFCVLYMTGIIELLPFIGILHIQHEEEIFW